jgi:hypothetical protein
MAGNRVTERELDVKIRRTSRPSALVAPALRSGHRLTTHVGLAAATTDATLTKAAALPGGRLEGKAYVPTRDNTTYAVEIVAVATQTGGGAGAVGDSHMWVLKGLVKQLAGAGTLAIVDGPFTVVAEHNDVAAAPWAVAANVNTTDGGVEVDVTGEASKEISWEVEVKLSPVASA